MLEEKEKDIEEDIVIIKEVTIEITEEYGNTPVLFHKELGLLTKNTIDKCNELEKDITKLLSEDLIKFHINTKTPLYQIYSQKCIKNENENENKEDKMARIVFKCPYIQFIKQINSIKIKIDELIDLVFKDLHIVKNEK